MTRRAAEQKRFVIHEYERNDKGDDPIQERTDADLERARALDQACCGVGRQGDRRRDGADDAEIEHEQVRREQGEAHLRQRRRNDRRDDDIDRHRGQAHAKDQRSDRRHQQRDKRRAAALKTRDAAGKVDADTRQVDCADNQSGRSTGRSNRRHTLDRALHGLAGLAGRDSAFLAQIRDRNEDQDRPEHGLLRGEAAYQAVDQDHQRQKQIALLLENGQRLRKVFLFLADEAVCRRFFIGAEEQAEVVQHSRKDRRPADLAIGDADVLRQNERCRAHHGRHDHAAGRGDRLDRAGAVFLVAGRDHQRDGKRAGGHNVCNGRAGNAAHQRAADDSRLGRAAAEAAGNSVRDVNKELACARRLQHVAEEDEQHDKRRTRAERGAVDALAREQQKRRDTAERIPAVPENARHIRAEEHQIDQSDGRRNGQREAGGPAGDLQDDKRHHEERDLVQRAEQRGIGGDLNGSGRPDDRNVDRCKQRGRQKDIVVPAHRLLPLDCGIGHDRNCGDHSPVDGTKRHGRNVGDPSRIHLEQT